METKDFIGVKKERLTQVANGGQYVIYKDKFWCLNSEREVLFYLGKHPQCNDCNVIANSIMSNKNHPGVEVEFIPVVYVPIRANDFEITVKKLVNPSLQPSIATLKE